MLPDLGASAGIFSFRSKKQPNNTKAGGFGSRRGENKGNDMVEQEFILKALRAGLMCCELLIKQGGSAATELSEEDLPLIEAAIAAWNKRTPSPQTDTDVGQSDADRMEFETAQPAMGIGNETGLKPVPEKNAPIPANNLLNGRRLCPFCNSGGISVIGDLNAGFHAWCLNCHATGPKKSLKHQAQEAWNNRRDLTTPKWHSIGTQPIDEFVILATTGGWVGEAVFGECDNNQWRWKESQEPIHENHKPLGWMELPEHPGKAVK